jgi:DeoR/GlpR family transcriptional regulator of sugar metabolism
MTDAEGLISDRGPIARRELIRQRVLADGYARLDELAKAFVVSLMTVHRDVDVLESEGWLLKSRGGVTANPAALVDAGVRQRMSAMVTQKAAITAVAASLVNAGQTLFLDDSTTVFGMVPFLAARAPLVIASNFLPVVGEAGSSAGLDLHLLGGQYHPRQEACFGRQTEESIRHMHADICFMSTTAITGGRCLYRSEASVLVRRAFMHNASRSVLLVDHAKFGRPAPHVLCAVELFDVVITDDGIDAEDLADLRSRCSDVRVGVSVA